MFRRTNPRRRGRRAGQVAWLCREMSKILAELAGIVADNEPELSRRLLAISGRFLAEQVSRGLIADMVVEVDQVERWAGS